MNNILYITMIIIISYCIVQTIKLEKTKNNLKNEIINSKILQTKYDELKSFKHDFSNIIVGIDGYIKAKDLEGLAIYYKQFFNDYTKLNSLETLNSNTINNPAIFSILSNKYLKAEKLGIRFTIECFMNFNKIKANIYIFSRVLGILLDNAIEAAEDCEEKLVNIIFRDDSIRNKQTLIIENSYNNQTDLDLDLIYKKGYSTKPNNTGLGLWKVNKIIKSNHNAEIFSSKSESLFVQKIEISY